MGYWSIAIGHFTWAFPFALLSLLVETCRYDTRLNDAAMDLGASAWRTFLEIEFPALRAGFVSAAVFGFLLSFNDLVHTILLAGLDMTLPLYDWAQASSHTSNIPIIYALATLVMTASFIFVGFAFWLLFASKRR